MTGVERRRRQNRLNQRVYSEYVKNKQYTVVLCQPVGPNIPRKAQNPPDKCTADTSTSQHAERQRQILEQLTSAAYASYLQGSPNIDHLFTLTKLNVYRAFATSIGLLGLIQRLLHHHPWLDFFPHPGVRDNLIRVQGGYDEDELCLDIFGYWDPGVADNMLLLWGFLYNSTNWEMTEAFMVKWDGTNLWRARRGESPITRYLDLFLGVWWVGYCRCR
ncbi:hypothetical protein BDV25DRAFT_128367 [Aspergillus avenaceus]|uniref:BZIP domain-containing protein n=1 Tax=Aspergillus avenaceus TaxID=36643 RepID=A0A5N6U064_ASPAV|nr:hypothetical protein BDV25DRAFT_128367 [Aspergillus avenaceus]